MISSKLAATLLYAYPALPNLISCYKKKLKYLYSFECNSREIAANVIYARIFRAGDVLENLVALRNAVTSALGFLSKEQREVVEGVYFKGVNKDKLSERLGVTRSLLRSRKNTALNKLRAYIEILGFTDQKVIEVFDDEPLFIDCAEKVAEAYALSRNFRKGGSGNE